MSQTRRAHAPTTSVAALWSLVATAGCAPPPPPVVLLVTLDTTRADAIGAYGAHPSPTPHLDALAASGLRFDDVWAPVPLTLPSHTSMFTGLSADRHGVHTNDGYAVPKDVSLLAERFAAGGYATGAFVSSWVLDDHTGIGRGFERFDDLSPHGPCAGASARRDGAATVDRALQFAAEKLGQPLFLWVHLFDAHRPWVPNPVARARFPNDPYAASLADQDAALATLLDGLGGRPLTVLVAADHGEGLGDHGEQGHGWLLHGATLRVPLVLTGPDVQVGVDHEARGLIDVGPTLLAMAGLPPLPDAEGTDLRAPAPPARILMSETRVPSDSWGFHELSGAKHGANWLVRGARVERFDLARDPREAQPIPAERHPLLDAWEARPAGREALGAGWGDALWALGYTASDPGRPKSENAKDPRDEPSFADDAAGEIDAAWRGEGDAKQALERRYAAHPNAPAVRFALARLREAAGDHLGAAKLIPEEGRTLPLDREVWWVENLVRGGDAGAKAALADLVARAPEEPTVWSLQAEAARLQGDCEQVAALAAARPTDERVGLIAGFCALEVGAVREAGEAARTTLLRCPLDPDALRLRALAALAAGDHAGAAANFGAIGPALTATDRVNLGIALVALGDPRAIDVLDGLSHPAAARLRAEALLRAGAAPMAVLAALDPLGVAIEADPTALRLRAQARLRAGDTEGAAADVARALALAGGAP